jgi:hypothetical protein
MDGDLQHLDRALPIASDTVIRGFDEQPLQLTHSPSQVVRLL